jgi:TonB family protein
MKTLDIDKLNEEDSKILYKTAVAAVIIEFIILTAFGWQGHWLAHPQKTGLDETKFIEAEIYQIPKEPAHLTEEKKIVVKAKEVVMSKKLSGSHTQSVTKPPEENQTDSGDNFEANHGPVAIVAPPPVIPSYLQDQDLNSSVVIEFFVNAQGVALPKLIGSSGNEELDAIALTTIKAWQFRPAEQGHKPVDSKVRLRINFQVR